MLVAALAVAAAVQPNLAKILLKPAAVGAGYILAPRTDGQGTAQRTLDLCGTQGYASEGLRVNRLQVDYVDQTSPLRLSNEVVSYKAGGAQEAMREVAQHAARCPSKPISFEGQPPLTYKLTRLRDSKLVGGYVALRMDVSGKVNGKLVRQIRFAVYQRVGNVLSGVYSYDLSGVVSGEAQQQFVLHAAEASAKALKKGAQRPGIPA